MGSSGYCPGIFVVIQLNCMGADLIAAGRHPDYWQPQCLLPLAKPLVVEAPVTKASDCLEDSTGIRPYEIPEADEARIYWVEPDAVASVHPD